MNKENIYQLIVQNICEVIPDLEGHKFKPDDKMVELGANSIDRVEIITMVMDALSLKIPRIDLAKAKNIGELAEVLYEKLQH